MNPDRPFSMVDKIGNDPCNEELKSVSTRVGAYLEQHRDEGVAQGEGYFSVGAEEALRKVVSFGLESPEKGLLRLVQLAVAGCCDGVEIRLLRNRVKLTLKNARTEALKVSELPKELLLEQNNFSLALLSCLHSGFHRGRVADGQSAWDFDRDGFQAANKYLTEGREIQIELERDAPSGFWNRLKSFLRARCLDHKLLSFKLIHCPVEVTMDGCHLFPPYHTKKVLYELSLEGPRKLRHQGIYPGGWPLSHHYLNGKTRKKREKKWDVFEFARVGARLDLFSDRSGTFSLKKARHNNAVFARLWIPLKASGEGRILFVKDGVVVGKFESDFSLPIYGAISAQNLDLDLSGLELADNKKLEKLMEYIYTLLERRLRMLGKMSTPKRVHKILQHGGFTEDRKKPEKKAKSREGKKRLTTGARRRTRTYDHKVGKNDGFRTKRRHLKNTGQC